MDSHERRRAEAILIGPDGHASDTWRAAYPLIVQHGREASLIAIKRANDLGTRCMTMFLRLHSEQSHWNPVVRSVSTSNSTALQWQEPV